MAELEGRGFSPFVSLSPGPLLCSRRPLAAGRTYGV